MKRISRLGYGIGLLSLMAACAGNSSTPPPAAPQPQPTEPSANPEPPKATPPAPTPQVATLSIACNFEEGWVAVVPASLGDPKADEFLMQALIGLTNEPEFWGEMDDYEQYQPYAAQRCGPKATTTELQPGDYVIFVGWAGQFNRTGYKNNGRIERVSVSAGDAIERRIGTADLDRDLPCISCPFLLALRDGQFAELGQILVDRYAAFKQGTDERAVQVDVVDGVVTLRLAERESEVSFIDAVQVLHKGQPLAPVGVPQSLHAVDRSYHTLATGDVVTMRFRAPIERGSLQVRVQVNGYYVLDRAR